MLYKLYRDERGEAQTLRRMYPRNNPFVPTNVTNEMQMRIDMLKTPVKRKNATQGVQKNGKPNLQGLWGPEDWMSLHCDSPVEAMREDHGTTRTHNAAAEQDTKRGRATVWDQIEHLWEPEPTAPKYPKKAESDHEDVDYDFVEEVDGNVEEEFVILDVVQTY